MDLELQVALQAVGSGPPFQPEHPFFVATRHGDLASGNGERDSCHRGRNPQKLRRDLEAKLSGDAVGARRHPNMWKGRLTLFDHRPRGAVHANGMGKQASLPRQRYEHLPIRYDALLEPTSRAVERELELTGPNALGSLANPSASVGRCPVEDPRNPLAQRSGHIFFGERLGLGCGWEPE